MSSLDTRINTGTVSLNKTYTRDTSVIIQQAWFNVFDKELGKLGWHNPSEPALVHYLNDGVIEVWENKQATAWLMDKLWESNQADKAWFDKQISDLNAHQVALKLHWDKGVVEDVGSFKEVVDHVFDGMLGFLVMYYSSLDERTHKTIRDEALLMRDKDVWFDENDKLIRNSLRHLYPELTGREVAVKRSEIASPPSLAELKLRMKGFVFLGERGAEVASINQFSENNPAFDFNQAEVVTKRIDEIRGQIAQPGKVRGKVRVVKRKDQINSVKPGEIIVSPMTTPDYLPAMKRAAAIVTDEGGVTCHAAIVARELKIACIIGTKIATWVLKDGDEVEVDADKGVVKILKRANV